MAEAMSDSRQTILLVSDNAELCAAARERLEPSRPGVRLATVASVAAAWRIVEDAAPAVILLEEGSLSEPKSGLEPAPWLEVAVNALAAYAPVVVIGAPEREKEIAALVAAGAADYVARAADCLLVALDFVERRLRRAQLRANHSPQQCKALEEDFGAVLRHELNNPLTGILGNAELLLAEVRRKNDGRLPNGGRERIETIAALAVRLRETVRHLSQEWEARQNPMRSA
jgi:signal transduction histidine kinase